MNLVVFAALIGVCQAGTFTHLLGGACKYPTWKCHCKLVYDCDGDGSGQFLVNAEKFSFKDLAPDEYPLRIPGKRWRRHAKSQEDFCERECYNRLNAFLSLDKEPTSYTYPALCMQLLAEPEGPFAQDGSPEPCCSVYLEYGLQWCDRKWNKELFTLRCLSRGVDPSFTTTASTSDVHHIFSVESDCTRDGMTDFTWCDSAPICTAPSPE